MKLNIGLAAALAGCVAAAKQSADVFILPAVADASSSTPSLTPSIARLLLLQRLAPAGEGPSVNDIPEDALEDAVLAMNEFGTKPVSIFDKASAGSPSQLVLMLEGLSDEQMKDMAEALESKPAFTIADPPSSSAHEKLVKNDFYNVGVTREHKCSIVEVSNPFEERCWSGQSTVAKYNVQRQPEALSDLTNQASSLAKLAASGEMETTILLFPASSQNSKANKWSDKSQELRRRQAEQVISALDEEQPVESNPPTSPVASDDDQIFYISSKKAPACFESEDSCKSGTNECSSRGKCVDKYAKPDGSKGKKSCFVCSCLSTENKDTGSVTHWAGPTCAKQDVSTPFWLFAGFTLVMVGILSLSIGMLFSVGEEKLPGVIGAGVSRSK